MQWLPVGQLAPPCGLLDQITVDQKATIEANRQAALAKRRALRKMPKTVGWLEGANIVTTVDGEIQNGECEAAPRPFQDIPSGPPVTPSQVASSRLETCMASYHT